MAKSPVVLLAALVAFVAGLLALVLFWDQAAPGFWQGLQLTLARLSLGLAVVASLGTMLAALAVSRRWQARLGALEGESRRNKGRANRLESELKTSRERTDRLESELKLIRERPEPEPVEKVVYRADPVTRYRTAVEMAWADEELNGEEKDLLSALGDELDLSRDQAADIERKVMGAPKEEIELHEEDSSSERNLDGEAWMKLVEECVGVVDELDRDMERFDPARQDLADHVVWRIAEVLERSEVDLIWDDETLDSRRHLAVKAGSRATSGAPIAETLSPGFAVGRRVIRRARVRLE